MTDADYLRSVGQGGAVDRLYAHPNGAQGIRRLAAILRGDPPPDEPPPPTPKTPAGGTWRQPARPVVGLPIMERVERCPRRVLLAPARAGCRCQDARCLLHDRIMSTADCISCQARQIEQETIDRTGAG